MIAQRLPIRHDLALVSGALHLLFSVPFYDVDGSPKTLAPATWQLVFRRHPSSVVVLLDASESVRDNGDSVSVLLTAEQSEDLDGTTGVYELARNGQVFVSGSYTTTKRVTR